MIGVGLIGSGFISDTYADALQDVRNAVLVANYSRDLARAEALGRKWAPDAKQYDDMAALCAD
ncbi:Gfo/Idh/MocA family oxidoreductase, partial [Actinacidiphila oryziradicis]|nr:Gfo/Idh/MocA family oxidoreductase [Actinacidiphila oryziradicis]